MYTGKGANRAREAARAVPLHAMAVSELEECLLSKNGWGDTSGDLCAK